ncbi:Slp family lipoprotein [Vibrio salilacus]|uniref:Slp family lipoprotein n=1 Tax=Vibrio salilacus TaxID=1323749 RepID=UPI000C2ACB0E|nr:Slp family lipoprotein [Vibrio salilacus]
MNKYTSQLLIVFLGLFTLSACSTLPDSLKSDNPNIISDYQTWQANPDSSSLVRLGGVIAKVTNLEQKTRIEVVNLPISSAAKPDINQEPQGRFVAYVEGFSDPVTLSEGRLISLIGESKGREKDLVGEYQYDFPVMKVNGLHLWRVEERVIVHEINSYLDPCFGLYCRDSNFSSGYGKVIKEVK